jgi:endonuclease G, mitochondrial
VFRKIFYLAIVIFIVIIILVLLVNLRKGSRENLPTDFDKTSFNYLPASTANQIIQHTNFTLSYSEKDEQAEWVAYQLTRDELRNVAEREDNFREDPKVFSGSATPDDYRRSGYDRGHLAPAGDMGFSEKAMSESFYMSNISPQDRAFNRGIWKALEGQTRDWIAENGSLYVVTGGVLTEKIKVIGKKNKVTVPKYFYKVLLGLDGPGLDGPDIKAIAFLLPNKSSNAPLSQFVISIDSLENMTGIDFFPALPDELEAKLESSTSLIGWKFNEN